MRATLALVVLMTGLLLTTGPANAHHSFAAEFDISQPITLKGVLTKMEWVNPHGWLYMDVTNPDGTVTNWAVEAGGPTALLRRGLRKTDFPAGTEIVVEGFRAKNGTSTANGQRVTMTDGRNFFLGPQAGEGGAPNP